jgi:hypothetical protein
LVLIAWLLHGPAARAAGGHHLRNQRGRDPPGLVTPPTTPRADRAHVEAWPKTRCGGPRQRSAEGRTLADVDGISVWSVAVGIRFGDGVFAAP